MRKLVRSLTPYGTTLFIIDVRDDSIACMDHLVEVIYRFRNMTDDIGLILLTPSQEYCLRVEHLKTIYNVKEDRPYRLDEIGPLEQVMGYQVYVGTKDVQHIYE